MTDLDDSLFEQVRTLQSPALGAEASDRIYRRAARELDTYGRGPRWLLELGRAWMELGVPALLTCCALGWIVLGVADLHRVYGPRRGGTAAIGTTAPDHESQSEWGHETALMIVATRAPLAEVCSSRASALVVERRFVANLAQARAGIGAGHTGAHEPIRAGAFGRDEANRRGDPRAGVDRLANQKQVRGAVRIVAHDAFHRRSVRRLTVAPVACGTERMTGAGRPLDDVTGRAPEQRRV